MIRQNRSVLIAAVIWIAGGGALRPVGADDVQVNTYTTGSQLLPSVAFSAAGDFVVVWKSTGSGDYSVQAQRYTSDGSTAGSEFQVNTYDTGIQRQGVVALSAAGDFVVVWESDGSSGTDTTESSIQGQRYAADGSTVGGEF